MTDKKGEGEGREGGIERGALRREGKGGGGGGRQITGKEGRTRAKRWRKVWSER